MLKNKKGQLECILYLIVAVVVALLPFVVAGAVIFFIVKAVRNHFKTFQK